jgi:hypothetical protein
VPAHRYRAMTRRVPGGAHFVGALPASACGYDSLAVNLPSTLTPSESSSATVLE